MDHVDGVSFGELEIRQKAQLFVQRLSAKQQAQFVWWDFGPVAQQPLQLAHEGVVHIDGEREALVWRLDMDLGVHRLSVLDHGAADSA